MTHLSAMLLTLGATSLLAVVLSCAGRSAPQRSTGEQPEGATAGQPSTVPPYDPADGPPVARRRPTRRQLHGHTLVDDYAWMRHRDDPEVMAYLEAENRWTEAQTAHLEALRRELYEEMVGRIEETDQSVPAPWGEYFYYRRTVEGEQYPIFCRKQGSLEAPEEVVLDVNQLAAEHDYFRLGALAVSPDHRRVAFSADTDGSERFTVRIEELATGELLDDEIEGTSWGLEWGNDSRTLFYVTRDEAHRPYKLWRHRLGSPAADDTLLLHEQDDAFFLSIHKSRSRRYLLVSLESNTTSEVHVLDADDSAAAPRRLAPRRPEVEMSLYHQGEHFYLLTNDGAKNFRLLRTPVDDFSPERWEEVLPHREEVLLEGVEPFAGHLVVVERRDGLRQLRVRPAGGGEEHWIDFPEEVYAVEPLDNLEYATAILRFQYSSLVTPSSVFDYHLDERSRELRKQEVVKGGYDPALYTSERIWARAADGTRVPVSLVYRGQRRRDEPRPCLLYGYGSYGAKMDPGFSPVRLSLLDRGWVWAIAHVRGGGELGERWHDAGKLAAKQNTFGDFIAAAEHLLDAGYTVPDRLAAMGGSAGGLLVGAVVNQRPELFAAAVAQVPFVDVVNTMLDPTIPLTVIEYEEWGNPQEREALETMLAYSPYDNVTAQRYPHLLVTAGLNDPRVAYWEPAKWVARLRATATGDSRLLLKVHLGAGHAGASGRYETLAERAFEYAFLLDVVPP